MIVYNNIANNFIAHYLDDQHPSFSSLKIREIETIKKLSTEIENRSKDNQDVKNLSNMKGIGNNSAATIVSEIRDIKQF
ncbi:MAG: hypothetical protein M1481_02400 [Candidatus Thermoplasmatota archaeon]|nr:hypothetical protein [Candidatus Thermoplasmatota archaeon]MCL5963849.1 hypothetical protein [Candidatus Thermoplasmatota archaeon]